MTEFGSVRYFTFFFLSLFIIILLITSCARGDTICLRRLQVDNIFAFICQVAPVPACWLFKTSATNLELSLYVPVFRMCYYGGPEF